MLSEVPRPLLAIAAIAILIICLGFRDKSRLDALNQEGVTVAGSIINGQRHSGKNTSYTLDAVFTTQTGEQFQKQFTVSFGFFNSHVRESIITNPSVQVRYQRSNTDNCIILGGSTDNVPLFPLGCFVLVVAIFVMYTMRGSDPLFE